MNVNIEVDKDFAASLTRLRKEYGEELASLNSFSDNALSHTSFINNFITEGTVADSSADPSANVARHDMPTLLGELPKTHKKLLSYNKIYTSMKKAYGKEHADKWLEMDYDGHLYLHDGTSASFIHYCYAYDLKPVAEKGLFFLDNGTFNAEPPQHLETFVDFVKEFISFTCNRSSGAVGLPNLLPYMYYFWKKDVTDGYYTHTPDYFARQQIQRFIYAVNQPYTRDGVQSAFTNTSIFDHEYFEAIFGGAEFPDGSFMIDYEDEIIDFQKLFMEVMSDIRSKNMMTFPVNTISLLFQNGKFVDEEFARWAIEHNRKWSDSNLFVDSTVNSLSNCCRLKSNINDIGLLDGTQNLDKKALLELMHETIPDTNNILTEEQQKEALHDFQEKVNNNTELANQLRIKRNEIGREQYESLGRMNSIGGTSLSVGSCKVSTINLARIALESDTEEEYLTKLKEILLINCEVLDRVRHIIKRNVEKGLLQNFTYGLVDFKHLYNTIGFIGIYETLKTFGYTRQDSLGNTYYTPEGEKLGQKIFDTLHNVSQQFIKEHNCDYHINCEQSPAETAADKLMKKDTIFHPHTVCKDLPLYGNQFMPLGIKATFAERVRVQALFDSFCNGGSILHANIDAPIDSFSKAWDLVHYIAKQGVTYFAFNPKIQACKHNHGFYGTTCPTCGSPAATEYTRIVGFFVPVNTWAKPRKEEYRLRQWEKINNTKYKEQTPQAS